jgi:DNA-binding SARP family transcriptional activator
MGGRGSSLRLLRSFGVVRDGAPVPLPPGAQRLIALVALRDRPVRREYAAGILWLDSSDERAAANLRSTLWRIQKRAPGVLDATAQHVALDPGLEVDLHRAARVAHSVLDGNAAVDVLDLGDDVLPDWYDDWVILERERFRQLRLLALEALCEHHLGAGRLAKALQAALVLLSGEPLRESTHRALIRIHLATGNVNEALRQYALCRRLFREQLGVEPGAALAQLFDGDAAVTTG